MSKKQKKRSIFPLVLLALLCIIGTELFVCKLAAPELYDKITQPVFSLVSEVGNQISTFFSSIQLPSFSSSEDEQEENLEPPENQQATAPALEAPPPIEDKKVTEFITKDGQEVLTGGVVEMVYFNQAEEPWANQPFGPDDIGGYGCGPTSLAMVVSSLSGEVVDPAAMAKWTYEHGYCAPGSGSYSSIVQGTAQAYGLTVFPWSDLSPKAITQGLAAGNVYVALMTRGHFTSSGHYIVLRGLTLDGKILVADPNSRERSLTAWDPQIIADELSATRSAGAPLWAISTVSILR